MTQPLNKQELLAQLRNTRHDWEHLLLDVETGRLPQTVAVGDWSVKGVLYHTTRYAGLFVQALEAHSRGEPPPPEVLARPDLDERNAEHFRASELKMLSDVVAESRAVFDRLIALVELQSDSFLTEPQRFQNVSEDVVVGRNLLHVCSHYRSHMTDLGMLKESNT